MTEPVYNGPWKQLRKAILQRDAYHCQLQLPGCTHTATEADHIIDWRDGGPPWDPANLRAACKHCNVAQRNTRLAQRAKQQRNPTSRNW